MCLAPRYRNGPIAAPLIDCRNTASLPDTPCALASPAKASSSTAATMTSSALRRTLILPMAIVARLVHFFAGGEHPFGTLGLGGLERQLTGGHQVVRVLHPVPLVDGARPHQHQIARF